MKGDLPIPKTLLDRSLFIMGDFPAPSQTFIFREMAYLHGAGFRVNVLAEKEVPHPPLNDALADIHARTIYLPSKARLAAGFLSFCAAHPILAAKLHHWALSLPHRTGFHRARFFGALACAATIAPRVKDAGITYLHAHFAGFQTELAMCLSRILGIPYGVTWHAYGIWRDNNILAEKLVGAEVAMTCTNFNVAHLKGIMPQKADDIHLVYHGVDLDQFHPDALDTAGIPMVCAVGRLVPKKGFAHLLDAASRLRDNGLVFTVNIVGDGPERQNIESQIDALNLQSVVTLLGERPNEDVIDLYRNARVLVAPSIKDSVGDIDGIPNVLLEAMAMARPVIGSNLSGIPEVVNSSTGLLVEPGDIPALAQAIERMLIDPDLAVACGQFGRALVEKLFDVGWNMERQLELFAKATGQ